MPRTPLGGFSLVVPSMRYNIPVRTHLNGASGEYTDPHFIKLLQVREEELKLKENELIIQLDRNRLLEQQNMYLKNIAHILFLFPTKEGRKILKKDLKEYLGNVDDGKKDESKKKKDKSKKK